jgi:hypothetical protein
MVKLEPTIEKTTWLRFENYRVVPLNLRLAGYTSELEQAMKKGIPACADLNRDRFYEIDLGSGWAYIHVRENAKTVYLVAYSNSNAADSSATTLSIKGLQRRAC